MSNDPTRETSLSPEELEEQAKDLRKQLAEEEFAAS